MERLIAVSMMFNFVSKFDDIDPLFDEFYLKICAKKEGEMLPKFESASGGTGGSVESSRDRPSIYLASELLLMFGNVA